LDGSLIGSFEPAARGDDVPQAELSSRFRDICWFSWNHAYVTKQAANSQGEGPRPPRQRGRASSERALIDAATGLFAERGPSAVTVRMIAERAGVNHGLVHHYFGSKQGLVRAVLADLAERGRLELERSGGVPLVVSNPDFASLTSRVFARVTLDNAVTPDDVESFPGFRTLARAFGERSGLAGDDLELFTAQTLALLSGWMLFEDWFLRAANRAPEDAALWRQQLLVAVTRLAARP
jgi:AcrR family transcriptional regulator